MGLSTLLIIVWLLVVLFIFIPKHKNSDWIAESIAVLLMVFSLFIGYMVGKG